jgi:CheY-like chemotaxis protein
MQCSTILIVDDDEDIRETLAELLELEGYATVKAANGAQALAKLRQEAAPCVILLDLMMPVMNGFEFLATQRADAQLAAIPVLVLSAGGTSQAALAGTEFFAKPVDLARLLSRIDHLCPAA